MNSSLPHNQNSLPTRYKAATSTLMHGGFGSVQPVFDTFLERRVMFKSMQNSADNDQLLNEIRNLSSARSRHVVEIYDVIFNGHGAVTGIIIEELTGRTYTNYNQIAASYPADYLKTLYQIATALADLHKAGIVHRDLKPQNFRDSSAGILKLYDFGLSIADENYQTELNRGTLIYAAPELYHPNAYINPAIDIYAFGVCAWALGAQSFPPALLDRPPQSTRRAPAISFALPGLLPDEVANLIDECLEPDPVLRPEASDLSKTLAKYLVRGKHKGIFTQDTSRIFELSATNNFVKLTIGALGEISVSYDNFDFIVASVSGSVYINNIRAQPGAKLHEACVLTFGDTSLGAYREWVTFSSSHPEVIL